MKSTAQPDLQSPCLREVQSYLDGWRSWLYPVAAGLRGMAFWQRCNRGEYCLGDPSARWLRRGRAGVAFKTTATSRDDPLQWCCGCAFADLPDLYAFSHPDRPETVHVLQGSKELGQIELILPAEPITFWKSLKYAWDSGVYRYAVRCGGLWGHIDLPASGVWRHRALLFLDLVDGQRLPIVASSETAGDRGNDDLVFPDAAAKLTEPQLVMYFMISVLFRVHYLTLDFSI